MKNIYHTVVTPFHINGEDEPVLSIEVPVQLLEDLDLKANEVLRWEIDIENRTATLTKENIIINNV